MASDAWARFTGSSRRSPFHSDPFTEEEETEVEEEERPEYTCPFCNEDFDMVGLCCHMDGNHAAEAKRGACPICEKKVGTDLVGHITTQHANLLKVQRRRRYRKGSALTYIRKELREGNLQNFAGGFNWTAPAANTEADPLLSSFMSNPPANAEPTNTELRSLEKAFSVEETSTSSSSERKVQQPVVSDKDYEESARKCEFVQGLVFSTFLDDDDGF